jgi:hypothetical protein
MPFHMEGHKPAVTNNRRPSGIKVRLQLAGFGALCLAVGVFRLSHDIHFVINQYAMPAVSGAIVGMGVTFVLSAMIPFSWIEKIAQRLNSDIIRSKKQAP